jgi:hypothetical protein
MEGSQSSGQYGISQRIIQKIFNLLQDKAYRHQQNMTEQDNVTPSSKFEYNIEVAMLEIYNDEGELHFATFVSLDILLTFLFVLIQFTISLTLDFQAHNHTSIQLAVIVDRIERSLSTYVMVQTRQLKYKGS